MPGGEGRLATRRFTAAPWQWLLAPQPNLLGLSDSRTHCADGFDMTGVPLCSATTGVSPVLFPAGHLPGTCGQRQLHGLSGGDEVRGHLRPRCGQGESRKAVNERREEYALGVDCGGQLGSARLCCPLGRRGCAGRRLVHLPAPLLGPRRWAQQGRSGAGSAAGLACQLLACHCPCSHAPQVRADARCTTREKTQP